LEQVIQEDGLAKDAKGHAYLTKSSFQKLKKLDSFLKESQRCSPLILGMPIPAFALALFA
jgi:hypothetical protein